MKQEQLSENGQEIRRLLGDGLSANGLAAALDCIYQKLKQDMADRPAAIGQEWATVENIMVMYGLGKAQASSWLKKAAESGCVRVQLPSGGCKGRYYNLADLAKLWKVDPLPPAANK